MEYDAFYEDSTLFPGICYVVDFVDTALTVHNFVSRTKIIPSFFKKRD